MMRPNTHKKGFTLVELLLAMSFLSILLLAIAMLVINITNIYTRGVTLTTVQRVGQAVSSELQQTLNQSRPDTVTYVSVGNGGSNGGRLCTGTITYAWNYGKAITTNNQAANDANWYSPGSRTVTGNQSLKDIRFVKLQDSGGSLCKKSGTNPYPSLNKTKATELVSSADRTIALYSFTLSPKSLASGTQTIYSITMTVGTDSSGFISGSNQCAPPVGGSDSFCAVNQFVFTARASTQYTAGGQ